MPNKRIITTISPHDEATINDLLKTNRYRNQSDLIRQALDHESVYFDLVEGIKNSLDFTNHIIINRFNKDFHHPEIDTKAIQLLIVDLAQYVTIQTAANPSQIFYLYQILFEIDNQQVYKWLKNRWPVQMTKDLIINDIYDHILTDLHNNVPDYENMPTDILYNNLLEHLPLTISRLETTDQKYFDELIQFLHQDGD